MNQSSEMAFYAKDTAEMLGIAPVTLRKWSAELEKCGWTFFKDAHDRRAYSQQDLIALRYLRDILRDRRESLENAAKIVAERYNSAENTEISPTALGERMPSVDDQIKLLAAQQIEFMQRQEELTQKLMQRLDEQERYIEERLKARDEKLTQALNEVLETKRLIAAAQEQTKKKWFQFWK